MGQDQRQRGKSLAENRYEHIIGHHGQPSYPGILQLTAGSTFGGPGR
ncbi:hypothetical protein NR798_10080 [Archangium gephyra]